MGKNTPNNYTNTKNKMKERILKFQREICKFISICFMASKDVN